jgi:hypothetical protein
MVLTSVNSQPGQKALREIGEYIHPQLAVHAMRTAKLAHDQEYRLARHRRACLWVKCVLR